MILALAALAAAQFAYPATVVKVIDGDSLTVQVAGWPAPFSPMEVRVAGIDTPEKLPPHPACEIAKGKATTVFAKTLLHPGDKVRVVYTRGQNDKYMRLLADVFLADGRRYADLAIASGLARAYHGGAKQPWC